MKLRFTPYGRRELRLFGGLSASFFLLAAVLAIVLLSSFTLTLLIIILTFLPFAWVLSFFRDPNRIIPRGEHRLVAPADGVIFDIADVEGPEFIGEECTRIGIFLSVFDCHINRVPCSGRVEEITYTRGQFFNALTKANAASARNESNFIGLADAAGTDVKVGVKQIAGRVARRIVCELKEGDDVERGQQFGMIKFGSRVELFIPKSAPFDPKLKVGAHVKAGRTVLGNLGSPSRNKKDEPDEPEQVEDENELVELKPGEESAEEEIKLDAKSAQEEPGESDDAGTCSTDDDRDMPPEEDRTEDVSDEPEPESEEPEDSDAESTAPDEPDSETPDESEREDR